MLLSQVLKEPTPKLLCLILKAPFLAPRRKLTGFTYETLSRFVDKAVPFTFLLVVEHSVNCADKHSQRF